MKGWATKPLGDVLELSRARVEPADHAETRFNYVGLESMEGHSGRLLPYQPTRGADIKSTKNVFQPGEILYGKLRPYLNKVHLAKTEGICSTDIYVLRPNRDHVHPSFAANFLRSPKVLAVVSSAMAGANLPRIGQEALLSIPIPVPPLPDQDRLVKLLEEADELRQLRLEANHRMGHLIPALFNDLFGDPIENPVGWPVEPVSSLVSELQGGRNENPAGADEAAGRYRVLKISAVTWGDFRPGESKPLAAGYEPPATHVVRAGDLLFSRANTTELVGATSYVFETPPNLLLPDKLWRFVWHEPRTVEPLYVWWLFQASSMRRELGRRATGTGGSMKNISKPKVMTLKVPVPPLARQKEFVQRALEIRELEQHQTSSRRRLDDLFQATLHRAFEGEL